MYNTLKYLFFCYQFKVCVLYLCLLIEFFQTLLIRVIEKSLEIKVFMIFDF